MIIKIFSFFLKSCLAVVIFGLIFGRIFLPATMEEKVIQPAREIPYVGAVLGDTWDNAGKLGPALTSKTLELADTVEKKPLNLNNSVEKLTQDITSSSNPKDLIAKMIEDEVRKKVEEVKGIPQEAAETIRKEVQKEVYNQVCGQWLSSGSAQVKE